MKNYVSEYLHVTMVPLIAPNVSSGRELRYVMSRNDYLIFSNFHSCSVYTGIHTSVQARSPLLLTPPQPASLPHFCLRLFSLVGNRCFTPA